MQFKKEDLGIVKQWEVMNHFLTGRINARQVSEMTSIEHAVFSPKRQAYYACGYKLYDYVVDGSFYTFKLPVMLKIGANGDAIKVDVGRISDHTKQFQSEVCKSVFLDSTESNIVFFSEFELTPQNSDDSRAAIKANIYDWD